MEGMTGQLGRGEMDLARTILAQCCSRSEVLDYTLPVHQRKFWAYFHQPEIATDIYYRQFDPEVWLSCLLALVQLQIVMMLSVWLFKRTAAGEEKFGNEKQPEKEEFSVKDVLSWSLGLPHAYSC